MEVAYLQYPISKGNPMANLEKVESMCKGTSADIVVLPELAFTGYYFDSVDALAPYASASIHKEIIERLTKLVKDESIGIITGMALFSGDDVYNAVVALDGSGIVHTHRKVSLTENERIYTRGNRAEVFSLKGIRIGVMICFEAWFPRLGEHLRKSGAQLFVMPSNYGGPWTTHVARVRALENNRPVILANRTGQEWIEGELETFRGESRIIDAWGNVCVFASKETALDVFDIEIPKATDFKSIITPDMDFEQDTVEHVIMNTNDTKR